MKKPNKFSIILSLFIVAILSLSVNAAANDPLSSKTNEIQKKVAEISNMDKEVLAQVGESVITNIDVLKYKAYSEIQSEAGSDEELSISLGTELSILEELITEELYLQLANEKGVSATIEDGLMESHKNRKVLESQPQRIRDIQEKLIASMGVSEEEYWNEIAPREYQKIISVQNLTNLLIEDGTLSFDGDKINGFGQELKNFKRDLYEKYKADSVK